MQQTKKTRINFTYPAVKTATNKLIIQECASISQGYTIWVGGAPGVGKTTLARRFQAYGFLSLDCEDEWNHGSSLPCEDQRSKCKFKGLLEATEQAHEQFNTSFVFGACYARFLVDAPKYVSRVLLLPNPMIYDQRWKARNPKDPQDHEGRYEESAQLSVYEGVRTIHQHEKESVDETIRRVCEIVKV